MAIYSGFSHEKWWFSIAMLVYQRVVVDAACPLAKVQWVWSKDPDKSLEIPPMDAISDEESAKFTTYPLVN
jgi:hypothetical protein